MGRKLRCRWSIDPAPFFSDIEKDMIRDLARELDRVIRAPYVSVYPPLFGDADMKEITAQTSELLSKLRENREKHIATFAEARRGYIDAALTALRNTVTTFERSDTSLRADEVPSLYDGISDVLNDAPRSHVEDYDNAIAMLELHTEEKITLSAADVARFVRDQWEWAEQFRAASGKYSSGRLRG